MFNQILDSLVGTPAWRRRPGRAPRARKRSARLEVLQLEDRTVPSDLLGTAASFAVLAGSEVTNTGPSVINGDLGVSPGTAITGFPPGIVNGTVHSADAVALQAQSDVTIAYNDLAGRAVTQTLTGQDLGLMTLTPGVYFFSTSAQLTGQLTLDFQGNPDALFVFQIGSTLTTASNSSVVMINVGDQEVGGCEVYWQVGSSATLGTTTKFVGNIVALTSITLNTAANLFGRALARNGAVTLDTNVITMPECETSIAGSISGVKFNDLNGNGVRNRGEPGLQGWTIYIDANNNGVLDAGETRTTTDANGNFTFANVGPGVYRVRELRRLGWVRMTNNPADIIATSGEDVTVSPFGNARLAALLPPSKLSLISRNMVPGVLARQVRFVENLYEMLLGRAPDRAGLRRYVRLLQAGFSRVQVATIFRADPTLLPVARFAPNQVLLKFKDGIAEADKARVRALVRTTQVKRIQTAAMRADGYGDLEVLRGPADVLAAVARLKRNPLVAFAEPNWVWSRQAIANDPYYANGSLWGMYSDDLADAVGPPGTTNPYGSQAEKAWAAGYTGSRTVYVGIIDEGIQFTHPDLEANVWNNPYDTPGDGIDNDGNGYVDDVHGWDFFNRDNSVYDGAGDDHGTHVAGTIAAQGGNSIGVAGVNWKVTYIAGKFLGPDGGYTTDAIRAIDYMTDLKVRHGLNIVATNNSWGGGGFSQGLLDAITRGAKRNILFVAAAGNDGDNNDSVVTYPSNYNTTVGTGHDAVIAVAAIDKNGKLASFSNYGTKTVDLGAPGVGIYSTVPSGSYGSYSGTSMATPHVTGAAALYAASHPGATAAQIKTAILSSTQATDSLNGKTVTGGRLDLGALIGTTPAFSIDDVTQGEGEGDAGATNFTFTVTLSTASSQIVSVQFATADATGTATATAGSDYTANSGTLTFEPGQTSKTVAVSVNGDTMIESDETFVVNLSNAADAAIANSQGIGTILDDDGLSPLAPLQFYVAAGKGRVKVFATDGVLIRNFKPYAGYNGALRVATGDVNEDGVQDVIVAVDGSRPIRIFDGLTGQPLASFRAFGAGAVTGPLWIAAGDVNGDGQADIVVGKGNGPRVKVFSGAAVLTGAASLLSQLRPFAQAAGGVRVATGLINNDALADVIVARGPSAAPRVKIFDGGKPGALLANFKAFGVGTSGLFIAAGDFTGDGRDDVIVGRGPGYPGHVRVFNVNAGAPQVVYGFLAFGGKTDGVRVAAIDVNDDQVPDILATRGRNSLLRVFDGKNPASVLEAFAAFPGAIGDFFVAGTGVAGA